jgi:CrcB protein
MLLIGLGGALGSVLRFVLGGWIQRVTPGSFPAGTLVVNVTGCLAIGFLGTLFAFPGPVQIREEYRLAILVGILGGFTTFSSFGRETFDLAVDKQFALAALSVLLSNGAGLGAVWVGHRVAQRFFAA